MDTKRLLRLADLVETIAPEKFDLRHWTDDRACGTVGCAIGWACKDEWFQNEGLELLGWPTYRGRECWEAIDEFFGFEGGAVFTASKNASFLFSEDSYVTNPAHPSEVAIRIRLFVEHHDEKVVRELELA